MNKIGPIFLKWQQFQNLVHRFFNRSLVNFVQRLLLIILKTKFHVGRLDTGHYDLS